MSRHRRDVHAWIRNWLVLSQLIGIYATFPQTIEAQTTSAEWSSWGTFGECSRTCGGGLSNKTRTCIGASQTCHGTPIRYRVCNQQGCGIGSETLRDKQCKTFNDVAIKDNYFHWIPHYSDSEPCALYCLTIETGFILKMSDTAWNGTTCGTYGRGVCIAGRCKRVGCDNIVGSRRQLDDCGVCGGDGKSCDRPRGYSLEQIMDRTEKIYQWDVRWKSCTSACVNATQSSSVICIAAESGYEVDDTFCLPTTKPEPEPERPCPEHIQCTFRWHTFKWSSCSRTCGEGFRYRRVLCLKHKHGSQRSRVRDNKCEGVKPVTKEACNQGDCPEWLTGPWSQCAGSCGHGTQKRKVVCKTSTSATCNSKSKPAIVQQCMTGRPCPGDDGSFQKDDSSVNKYDFFDDAILKDLIMTPTYKVTTWGPCTVTCGVGYRHRNVTCVKGDNVVPLSQCRGPEPHSKRECYEKNCPITDDVTGLDYAWHHGKFGACSQTCGRGIQTSIVECFETKSNRIVLDIMCEGQVKMTPTTQFCNEIDCDPSWKVSEYGDCSVQCGGGRQSRTVDCVQTRGSGRVDKVEKYRCPDPIPMSQRPCNPQYCQAEWSTGIWGECSVTCGMGIETRSAYCVKYLQDGVKVNVSDLECLAPRPALSRQCHFGDCYKLQHLPAIKEQEGTFIQIKRSKKVKLIVGETAVLLPNQAIKVRCPVKNFHKTFIFWTKDHRLIPMVGRVRVSSNGALRISRAHPNIDTGVFTCSVGGMLQANVNLTFHSKKEAKHKKEVILKEIFSDKPQKDGMFKMKENNLLHLNSIENNDFSSFTTTKWTDCSSKCGWGTQNRLVTCNQVTDNFIRLLPEGECEKKGLEVPASSKKCIIQEECPQWVTTEWTECSTNNCSTEGYATQSRHVTCEFRNGTKVSEDKCDVDVTPESQRQCKNPDCIATWHTSRWTICKPQCGIRGKKVRSLSCVWTANKKPAYDNCKEMSRPPVSKRCRPAKCPPFVKCVDRSLYCSLARQLELCRNIKFRQRCCETCRKANL